MGRALKHAFPAGVLAGELGLALRGSAAAMVDRIASRGDAGPGSLGFVKAMKFIELVPEGGVVITQDGELAEAATARGASVIVSPQPRFDYARALALLEGAVGFRWSDEPAFVHPTASVGQNVVLGRGVRVGAYTRLMHNIVVGDEVVIGERCIVKSGTVIGEPGFGFERVEGGPSVRILHLGGVRIGDDVELGSLNTVVRGAVEDTVLHDGVKTDDHVHVAHNCVIGPHTFLTACVELSGGVTIGREVWVAPNASVNNQVRIGDRALIGLGAVVRKDVLPGEVIVGNPGRPLVKP